MTPEQIGRKVPGLDMSRSARFPIVGGLMQRRAGTARHDAVAWGYARGADRLGVDIIENCEVTGFMKDGDRVVGVTTTRGEIRARKVAVAVAGSHRPRHALAGIDRLPIESHVLQAFVSESLKPFLDTVATFGMGHFYVASPTRAAWSLAATRRLQFLCAARQPAGGRGSDERNAGAVPGAGAACACCAPGAASWICRWTARRSSPPVPLPGMYLNCGWCYGGFKATPASGWCFAWTIAKDEPHALNAPFTLDRFNRGMVIDDKGQGPTPRLH